MMIQTIKKKHGLSLKKSYIQAKAGSNNCDKLRLSVDVPFLCPFVDSFGMRLINSLGVGTFL